MPRKLFNNRPVSEKTDALQAEQTRLLYATLPAALITNALLALILLSTQTMVISPAHVYAWLAIFTPILLARVVLLIAWRRSGIDATDSACWLRRFRIATIATGMAWGTSAVLLFPAADIDHQSYLAFVIAGLSAGAVSSLAVDCISTLGFLVPTLLPLIARFGLEGDKLALSMGLMVMLFFVAIMANASRGRRSLHENILLRVKAEAQEQSLRNSEERLNQAQRTAHIGNWELDLLANKLYWSDEIYRIFEIDPAAFEPSYESFLNAIHPDDRDAVNLAYTRSLETRKPYETTHRLRMNDGRIKWVTERCDSVFDTEGKPIRSVGTVQDVTERKQFEESLRESEQRYHFLFSNNPMPMWVFAEDSLRFLEVNNRALEHYGYSREQFNQMTLQDIRPAEGIQELNRVLSGIPNGIMTVETRHKKKDGTLIDVIINTMPMTFGGAHARIVLVQDITERKQFEERLQQSEEQARTLFDAITDIVFLHRIGPENERGNYVVVNETACRELGYSREELMEMKPRDVNLPGYPRNLDAVKQQVASEGHAVFESIYVAKDGRQFPVEISAKHIAYRGEPMILSVVRDISARKQAESEREEQRRNQRALLNAIQESTFLVEKNGTLLSINEIGAERLNTTPDALLGKNIYEILPPALAQARRAKFERIGRTGIPETSEDERAGRRLLSTIYPVRDAAGEVTRFAVYAADVTQQHRIQAIEDMFSEINRKVLQGLPLSEVLTYICTEVAKLFDLSLIWVGRKENDGTVGILAHAGAASGYVDGLKRLGLRWDDTPQGRGASGRTIRSGQVQITNPSDPGFKVWRDLALEYHFQSMMGIPLLIRGEVYGAFTLYSSKPDFFSTTTTTTTTTDLLVGIATRISVALEAAMDQQQILLLSSALAETGNGVMITSPRGIIQWVNPAFARLSGYSKEELIGQTPRLLKSGQQSKDYYQILWDTISQGQNWSSETVERAKDGSIYTVSQTITPMLDDDGKITHYIAIHEDITAQKLTRERIQYMAHYDALTSLPNRALFYDRLQQALSLAKRNRGGLALLFLDLDGFKKINDTLGHHAGDLLLVAVAQRLRQCIRESDTVARLGGDEFTVILNEAHEQHNVAQVAEKIIAEISHPFDLEGNEARIGVSIGISRYSEDADSEDELVKNADAAMYEAKSAGKNTYRFGST